MKISVIVPVYNVESYLERCLESLIKQDYDNIEIVLINDGSTDNSCEICKKYAKNNNNIIFIDQENKGIAETRNIGLRYSTGDYITFLDSDDWVASNIYSTLIKIAEENNSDIVICGHKRVYENGKTQSVSNYKQKIDLTNYQSIEANFTGKLTTVLWDKLYKRKLFIDADVHFPNIGCFEDQVPNIKLLLEAKKITVIPDELVFYYQRYNSITKSNTRSFELELFNELDNIKSYLIDKQIYYRFKDSFKLKCINLILGFIINKSSYINNKQRNDIYVCNIKNYIEEYSKGYLSNEYFSKKVKLKIFLLLNFHQIYFNIYKIKLKLGYYLELYLSKNESINIENNQ